MTAGLAGPPLSYVLDTATRNSASRTASTLTAITPTAEEARA